MGRRPPPMLGKIPKYSRIFFWNAYLSCVRMSNNQIRYCHTVSLACLFHHISEMGEFYNTAKITQQLSSIFYGVLRRFSNMVDLRSHYFWKPFKAVIKCKHIYFLWQTRFRNVCNVGRQNYFQFSSIQLNPVAT